MTDTQKPKQELLVLTNPIEVFTGGSVRSVLDSIKEGARSIVIDPATEKGRKEIASLAYKIARTKTALDDAGKSLTEEQRKFIEKVNEDRKIVRDELDELKDEIRKPLSEYEEREKARVARHESKIGDIAALADPFEKLASHEIAARIEIAKAVSLDGFDEFRQRAETTLHAALHKLDAAFTLAKEEENRIAQEEAARVERERKEREEREAKIAAEAAERARIEAEQKAAEEARKAESAREAERKAEADRIAAIEREKAETERKAKEAQEAAERARIEVETRHKIALVEAETKARLESEEKDRQRLAAIEAERVAAEKKAANEKHRNAVRVDAVHDLIKSGLTATDAEMICKAIEAGTVAHITLNF